MSKYKAIKKGVSSRQKATKIAHEEAKKMRYLALQRGIIEDLEQGTLDETKIEETLKEKNSK